MTLSVAAVMAHPDDIEIHVAGTLALLRERGASIHFINVCLGDLGSMVLGREEIAAIRRREAIAAAEMLGATYDNLGVSDLRVTYCPEIKGRLIEALRRRRADVVITHARADYMADHEITAQLAAEACFAATIPNWETPGAPELKPLDHIPELFYADPTGLRDADGEPTRPEFVVDVSSVQPLKEELLKCHASQRDWLREQHGEDNYILSMRGWAAERGALTGAPYGEGFRRRLSQPFPRDSRMMDLLGPLVSHPR